MNKVINLVKQHMVMNVEFAISIIVIGALDCFRDD